VIKFTAEDVLSLFSTFSFFISLSARLLSSLSLRKLLAGNNRLQRLPDLLDHVPLEVLDLQHNKLGELPESLFYKALKWVNPPSALSSLSLCTHPLSSLVLVLSLPLSASPSISDRCFGGCS
jgi:PH domain/leucine-rich repeat-containing protein phosphatase